jgi:hypothetical protein
MYNKKELNDEICKEMQIKTSLPTKQSTAAMVLEIFAQKKILNYFNKLSFDHAIKEIPILDASKAILYGTLSTCFGDAYKQCKK